MNLIGLLDAALADTGLATAARLAREGGPAADQVDLTGPAAIRPFVVAAIAADARDSHPTGPGRPVLAVTATTREAEDLATALADLLPADQVAVFPAWETLPHERLSPRSDTVGRRLGVLRRLAHPDPTDAQRGPIRVVVAPVRSVLQPQLKGLGDLEPVELRAGAAADLDEVAHRLVELAYARVDLVTKRGEFAVRGGLLDVFAPTDEHPVRVEFWGDDVEEIRTFAVADQRTIEKVDRLWAPACRELLLTPEVRQEGGRARRRSTRSSARSSTSWPRASRSRAWSRSPRPCCDGTDNLELLLDCMPAQTHVLLCDPERIRTRAHDLVRTSEEFLQASWAAAASSATARRRSTSAGSRSRRSSEVRATARDLDLPWWTVAPFGIAVDNAAARGRRAVAAKASCRRSATSRRTRAARSPSARSRSPLYHGETARGRRRREALGRRRLAGRARLRGARPGAARGRGAARRGHRHRAGRQHRRARRSRARRSSRPAAWATDSSTRSPGSRC